MHTYNGFSVCIRYDFLLKVQLQNHLLLELGLKITSCLKIRFQAHPHNLQHTHLQMSTAEVGRTRCQLWLNLADPRREMIFTVSGLTRGCLAMQPG